MVPGTVKVPGTIFNKLPSELHLWGWGREYTLRREIFNYLKGYLLTYAFA